MRHRRLIPIVLLLALVSPTTALGATPVVTVDNSAGNVVASGAVVKSDPGSALVTVTNGYHFWVAVDLQPPVGGASLRPASIFEDVGGLYAAGGLIGPGGTAAWDGKFNPATGGSQAVRLHYELTSAGGAAALAGNLLTIIADSLGASTSVATPEGLLKALTLVTDLPSFVDLSQAVQKHDIWGVVTTVELLLQSGTGRTTLRAALSDVGVVATDKQLLSAGSVVGIMDWAWTLIDMMRSSVGDHFDGTVTFSVASQTPAPGAGGSINPVVSPSPTPAVEPTPPPTDTPVPAAPPPSPTSVAAAITCMYTTDNCPMDWIPVTVSWSAPAGPITRFQVYYNPGTLNIQCTGTTWTATGPPELVGTVGPDASNWSGQLAMTAQGGKYSVVAVNDAGSSAVAMSDWVELVDEMVCE